MALRTLAVLHDSPDFGGHEKAFLTWLPALLARRDLARLDVWFPETNAAFSQALAPFVGDKLRLAPHQFEKKSAEPLRAFTRLSYGRAVRRFVAAGGYDAVVLLQGRIENLATPMTWLPRRTPLISYVPMAHSAREMGRSPRLAAVVDAAKSRLYRRPQRWVVPAGAVKAQLVRAGARSPIVVVENVPPLSPTASAGAAASLALIETTNRVALFIGRFDAAQKGLDRLVRALRAQSQGFAGWSFVFVGAGPYAPVLESLKAETGLDVHVHGWTQTPIAYLKAADVLVMPSRFEGVPLVLLESLGVGTPVLGSDIDVFREYLPSTALYDFDDADGLRQALDALVRPEARAAFKLHAWAISQRLDIGRSQAAFAGALLDDLDDLKLKAGDL